MTSAALLLAPVTCVPAWFARYLAVSNKTVASGHRWVDNPALGTNPARGNVQAAPAALAADAGQKLLADMSLPAWVRDRGNRVTLEAYTLARNMTSEVGTTSIGDAVAVGQDAVNQAVFRGHGSVAKLLVFSSSTNAGYYGPINAGSGKYDRWAATTLDPTVRAIVLAQDILDGVIPSDFNKGGLDQANVVSYKNPTAEIATRMANAGNFWVGPLPGANHRRSMHFAHLPGLDAPTAAALVTRGLAAIAAPATDWSKYPVCDGGSIVLGPDGKPVTALGYGAIAGHGAALVIGGAVTAVVP